MYVLLEYFSISECTLSTPNYVARIGVVEAVGDNTGHLQMFLD